MKNMWVMTAPLVVSMSLIEPAKSDDYSLHDMVAQSMCDVEVNPPISVPELRSWINNNRSRLYNLSSFMSEAELDHGMELWARENEIRTAREVAANGGQPTDIRHLKPRPGAIYCQPDGPTQADLQYAINRAFAQAARQHPELAQSSTAPDRVQTQPNYGERMFRGREDMKNVQRTGQFYNPRLKAFNDAWHRAMGNSAIRPDLTESDLAELERQIDVEWQLRGRPKPPIPKYGGDYAPLNPSLHPPGPYFPNTNIGRSGPRCQISFSALRIPTSRDQPLTRW